MAQITGIEIEKNDEGQDAFIRIDLKKYGKQLQPFLEEVGIAEESNIRENSGFEEEWANSITKEELLKRIFKHIDSLPWKK